MPTNEICRMSATEIRANIVAKALSPVEVTDAVLERIESLDPAIRAFCTVTSDPARATARRIEDAVVRGEPLGPLAGIPVSVKDLLFTEGVRTAGGSWAYRDFTPAEDDVAVERIAQAGGVIVGKTTVPEFGYSGTSVNAVSPPARNPWDLDLTPGGSSSGSAAAVAAGMGPLTLGSDGGGSVRIPASFCGLFGMKPSMGRVPLYPGCRDPRYPGFSSWESLEQLGPLTRTVADAALLLSVIAGPDPRDRHSIPVTDVTWEGSPERVGTGLKIAYSEDWGYAPVDQEVRAIVRTAARVFADELGCVVEEVDPAWADPAESFWGLVVASTDLVGMRRMAFDLGDKMSPHLLDMLSRHWSADEIGAADLARKDITLRMAALMSRYDVLLTPTVGTTAFPLGPQFPDQIDGTPAGSLDLITFASPMNMTGQPAASVPAGWTASGLPVGLQIVGPHLGDSVVMDAARAFEQVRPWAQRWPAS